MNEHSYGMEFKEKKSINIGAKLILNKVDIFDCWGDINELGLSPPKNIVNVSFSTDLFLCFDIIFFFWPGLVDPSLNVSPLPLTLHTSAPLLVYDPASCSCPRASNKSPMGVLFSPMLSSLFSILFFRLRSLSEACTRTTIVRQRRDKYVCVDSHSSGL